MEWNRWCRLCGKENGNKVDIFIKNENFSNTAECIQKFFSITINHFDEMPTKICQICSEFLTSLLSFSDRSSKVQQMFLELEYNLKIAMFINLDELRIKYGIENIKSKFQEQPLSENESANSVCLNQSPVEESKIRSKRKRKISTRTSKHVTSEATENIEKNLQPLIVIDAPESDSKPEITNIIKKENQSDLDSVSDGHEYKEASENYSDDDYPLAKIFPAIKLKENVKNINNDIKKTKRKLCKISEKRIKKKYLEEEKKIQCEICQMKFVRENNLSVHLKRAHKIIKELPPCEYCGKICKTKQKLKFHRELHLPPEEREKLLFKCPLCEVKFTQKGAMRSHIRGTHSHERPFVCEACGKAFTSQSNLWAHRKKSHEENLTACEICQKICKNSSSLRKHMGTHKEPSIPCSVCGILLKTKKTLKNHMLVHSDVKAFQCNYCGKEFKRDITLQLHMIIHSGLKPYVCRFCEQNYANPSNCKKHEKHSHPLEFQTAEGINGPSQPHRILKKLPNIKQLKAMLEDMKAVRDSS